MTSQSLIVRHLGLQPYHATWQAMKAFTASRDEKTPDEAWVLQHPPVFTQGQAGKPEHLLNPGDIEVVQTDRGGQVTYHGPGQIVLYVLFDLRRLKLTIRQLVTNLERTVIQVLENYHITGQTRCDAPGVYVDAAKICSIGLRVSKGCTYHGIAFNIDLDLSPFNRINPCGFQQLPITQIKDFYPTVQLDEVSAKLVAYLQENFGYNRVDFVEDLVTVQM